MEDDEIPQGDPQTGKEIGLEAITPDGEFRRAYWHFDFLQHLDGCEGYWMEPQQEKSTFDTRQAFKGATIKPWMVRVIGKVDFSSHPHIEHFKFLKANTTKTPKAMIPSASMLNYRGGRKALSARMSIPISTTTTPISALLMPKPCRRSTTRAADISQIDDVAVSGLFLGDPAQRAMLKDRGDDADALFDNYRQVFNAAIRNRPKDMVVTTHLCRGNFRSTFVGSGGYQPIADKLFNDLDVDGYFLEWDSERAGGFEPLASLPKGNKTVVLGLITSKSGALENKDAIKRRIRRGGFKIRIKFSTNSACRRNAASPRLEGKAQHADARRTMGKKLEKRRRYWAKEVWG